MDHTLNLPSELANMIPTSGDFDCQNILKLAIQLLARPIFNHSLRVYLLATRIAEMEAEAGRRFVTPTLDTVEIEFAPEHLFAACMFHDMGTCSACNGPQRFDVEGADAAVKYLRSLEFTNTAALQKIWSAIALHNTAGIAERIDVFVWLVRIGVKADFDPATRDRLGLEDFATKIEECLPRLKIEQCLANAVVAQAGDETNQGLYVPGSKGVWTDSTKFPKASWPGIILRGQLERVQDEGEGWQGRNPAF